jgi:KaiC/GvpD/RAD55 family RecA-like ATPase
LKLGVFAEPVLVGREHELEELEFFLNSALEGKGKIVFVSGEAGSGKTRLAREFLNHAKKKNVALMAGWCLSDAAIPYFPFIEAFSGYFATFSEEEQITSFQQPDAQLGLGSTIQFVSEEHGIAELLTGPKSVERMGKPEALSPQVWKDQAFAAVAKTLNAISAQVPIVLFVEDIHWADSASLALLHYIARAVHNSERILVLATFRSEELTADSEGHPHPLSEAMRMMRREDLFTEIKLSSLSQSSVSKIAENMIGGSLQPMLAEKLTAESRGNPLFIVESLRMLHERRSLIQEDNKWRLATDELAIPTKIKDIILRRLAVLKYTQRRVLDAASVIGEKFDVELLSLVLGLDSLEVLETLNVIAHSTSLVCVEENCYRFDHARSRETLYEELSPPLKRGYHARIAEKLETTKDLTLLLSDLAYHFAEAGNKEKALKYAFAAAKDDLTRFSNSQAIKHFAYVLQNIPEDAAHYEEKRTALEGLGDAYAANSMYTDAIKTFGELATSGTGAVRLRALRKAMDAAFLKGDTPEVLLDYAKKAEELAAYDRLEMARVIDNRGRAFGYVGHGDLKMDLADYRAALQIFEEENSLADVAEALWRSGVVCTLFEDLAAKGLAELARSVAIFRELGDVRREVEATLHMGVGLLNRGLFPESFSKFAKVIELGEKIGCFSEMAQASSNLAFFPESEGKIEEAISLHLRALDYWKKTDLEWLGGYIYGNLIRLYVRLGDIEKAEEYGEKLSKTRALYAGAVFSIVTGEASLSAAKNQWQIEISDVTKKIPFTIYELPIAQCGFKNWYGWLLQKQGKVEQANILLGEAMRVIEQAEQEFLHANVQGNLMMPRKIQVGEEVEMRLDAINVGRRPGAIAKIEGLFPPEFKAVGLPSFCSLQNGSIQIKDKAINGFEVETIKLKVEATKVGSYDLKPEVFYVDDMGKMKAFKINPIAITVQPFKPAYEALPGRISTGYAELDRLLFGGIPEKYAVVLSAPSCDEREMLVNHYLRAGAEAGETTFHITSEAANTKALAEEYPSNFYLLVCNPQADSVIQNLPNVYKLKGVENLTDIDIALTKAFRSLNASATTSKRICLEIISDALLQHHAVNTRRWLSALLPTLKSKGFMTLAVVNPRMHPLEDFEAILGVFDGEIRISEKETSGGSRQSLRIRKLYNQKYLENEIILTKESLST